MGETNQRVAGIKGYSLLSSRNVVERFYGKAAVQKVIDALPPEDQVVFSNPILSHAFYPLDAYVHWLEQELRILYNGDQTIIESQFLRATEKAVKGIYGVVQRFGSPAEAVEKMGALRTLENVRLERRPLGEGRVLLVFWGFEKRHAIFEVALRCWWLTVARMTGGKEVTFDARVPIANGKDRAEYLLTWTK